MSQKRNDISLYRVMPTRIVLLKGGGGGADVRTAWPETRDGMIEATRLSRIKMTGASNHIKAEEEKEHLP